MLFKWKASENQLDLCKSSWFPKAFPLRSNLLCYERLVVSSNLSYLVISYYHVFCHNHFQLNHVAFLECKSYVIVKAVAARLGSLSVQLLLSGHLLTRHLPSFSLLLKPRVQSNNLKATQVWNLPYAEFLQLQGFQFAGSNKLLKYS